MPFAAELRKTGESVVLEVEGDLDSTTAQDFRAKVEEATKLDPSRLVIDMRQLDYISSAGLRVLVFARQKMGDGTRVVLVGANAIVTETIQLTGFHNSVTLSDELPPVE